MKKEVEGDKMEKIKEEIEKYRNKINDLERRKREIDNINAMKKLKSLGKYFHRKDGGYWKLLDIKRKDEILIEIIDMKNREGIIERTYTRAINYFIRNSEQTTESEYNENKNKIIQFMN